MNIEKTLPFSLPEFKEFRHSIVKKISISGVQPKYSLKMLNGKLQLTEKNGEYILKPVYGNDFDFPSEMPANEHITMQIAKQVFNLDVAENALVFFPDKTPAYLTKRFDVLPSGEKLKVEDFAQLAGITGGKDSGYKYDFSYQEMADVLKNAVGENYLSEAEKLFNAIVFNYLVNNGDAHIKNFSVIFSQEKAPVLTPLYDLLNTRLHLPSDAFMALDLFSGGYETPAFEANGFYSYSDFAEFGEKIGLEHQKINAFLQDIPQKVPKINEFLENSALNQQAIDKYKEYIADRAKALMM
ncbi:MAG: HipA domain-containing protein [Fibromonadales bacterium]|nr:HipA domain-containing protein [Fibromonadales bacterium]